MINYRNYILLFFMIISGCAVVDSHDSRQLTRFDPVSQHEKYEIWRYEAFVPAGAGSYGMNELGEATRVRWLQKHLQMNGLSPVDYEIIETKSSVAGQGWVGSSHRIFYVIKAKREDVGIK